MKRVVDDREDSTKLRKAQDGWTKEVLTFEVK
jgi:hypothetical protein